MCALSQLEAKITAEGEAEAKAYDEYADWCKETKANTGFEIKTEEKEKAGLEADIEKATADGAAADAKIEEASVLPAPPPLTAGYFVESQTGYIHIQIQIVQIVTIQPVDPWGSRITIQIWIKTAKLDQNQLFFVQKRAFLHQKRPFLDRKRIRNDQKLKSPFSWTLPRAKRATTSAAKPIAQKHTPKTG